MPRLKASNNYSSTLAANLAQAATSLTVASDTGSPAVPFMLTLLDTNGDVAEIIEVGAKASTTFSSLSRGQESTSDQAHTSGARVEHRWTAGMYDELVGSPASAVQGDVLYHNGTTWARLAAGTSGQFLKTLGAAANPAWAAAGGLTLAGNDTTERTTNSTSATDLVTISGLSIPAGTPVLIVGSYRKTSGAAARVGVGLKVNATVTAEAATGGLPGQLASCTATDRAEIGLFRCWLSPRSAGYEESSNALWIAREVGSTSSATNFDRSNPAATASIPIATITSISLRGISGSASVTLAVKDVFVYTLAAS